MGKSSWHTSRQCLDLAKDVIETLNKFLRGKKNDWKSPIEMHNVGNRRKLRQEKNRSNGQQK